MAICWERVIPLASHLCCFCFGAVLVVGVPFPVWCLGQDVEFDCIDSLSLPFYLLAKLIIWMQDLYHVHVKCMFSTCKILYRHISNALSHTRWTTYTIRVLIYYIVTVTLRFSHDFSTTCLGPNTICIGAYWIWLCNYSNTVRIVTVITS